MLSSASSSFPRYTWPEESSRVTMWPWSASAHHSAYMFVVFSYLCFVQQFYGYTDGRGKLAHASGCARSISLKFGGQVPGYLRLRWDAASESECNFSYARMECSVKVNVSWQRPGSKCDSSLDLISELISPQLSFQRQQNNRTVSMVPFLSPT